MNAPQPRNAGAFELFLDAMPDCIVVTGADGRIVYANGQAESVSGYSREELRGRPIEDLVPDGLRSQHLEHRRAYLARPTVRQMGSHLDIRFRRRDGSEFPADIALSPIGNEGELLVVASVRDLTERKRAEAELLEAEERFRLMVDGVRDYAIIFLDPEGRISTWNPGAARIEGYAAEEILGRHFSLFYEEADVAAGRPEHALGEAARRGQNRDEGWRLRKDGSRFWASVLITALYDDTARLRGFAKITGDVTERKRQDDRLRALLEVAQSILEGRDDEVVVRLIAVRARALVAADLAAVAIVDSDGSSLVVRTADGTRSGAIQGLRMPVPSTGPGSVVATSGPAAPGDDPEELVLAKPMLEAAGAGPALIVPLTSHGRRLGTLALANEPGGRPFSDSDLRLVELFAAQAAVAIDYTRVRDQLQRLALVEDRERIGRELHDGAIQSLFAVGMSLQGVAMITADATLRDRLEASVTQIDAVIRDLRNYIFGLRPGLAADRHLSQALRELASQFEEQHGVACAVDIDEGVASRLAGRAADLVQLTREALSNVGRHAAASTCRLSLRAEAGQAVLEIEDDGRGFAPGRTHASGWGLRNLEDRAGTLGGGLEIISTPGEGTTVRLVIPV